MGGGIRDERSSVARGSEVLARMEAEASDVPDRSCPAAADGRAMSLGGILDHVEAVPTGLAEEGLHGGRLAVEVHGEQGSGARRDGRRHLGFVDEERRRIGIDQDRRGPRELDGRHGGVEGVGVRDHLVAGTDAQHQQGHDQGVRTGVHSATCCTPR